MRKERRKKENLRNDDRARVEVRDWSQSPASRDWKLGAQGGLGEG